ncbi:MAG: hypothetical protein C4B56_07430 [Candidatus Methanophagaceae archaeon]|nr:MAG: hypothetical protein C4B56_07430 [Methanophagales archaeon]
MRSEGKARKMIILSLILVLGLPLVITVPAMAYTIDGDLDDWGVNPNNSWTANPPALSVYDDWQYGPTSTGSHHNPGIEQCDIEAMYAADGGAYVYFAIITSMPPEGYDYVRNSNHYLLIPGDLALNLDNDNGTGEYGYEYGIKLTNDNRTVLGEIGDVFYMPDWEKITSEVAQDVVEFSNMVNGTKTGHAEVVYKLYEDWPSDNGASNYVIEMKVPKDALGISGNGTADLLATVSCTNDALVIEDFTYTPVPEFTTIAVPLAMVLGLFYYYRRKRQGEGENKSE